MGKLVELLVEMLVERLEDLEEMVEKMLEVVEEILKENPRWTRSGWISRVRPAPSRCRCY